MKKIIVTGHVGKDPEMRADQSGNQLATSSVGVSVGTKQNPKTDWCDVTCNGKLADIARNYVKKGTKVLIEGYPTASAYINRDNEAVASLRIYANNVELLSKKEDEQADTAMNHGNEPVYQLPETNATTAGAELPMTAEVPF